jgi:hypothetical protein
MYIWEFYTLAVLPGVTNIKDIWFEKDGKHWGRPKSYCTPCNRVAQRGKEAIDVKRAYHMSLRGERIDDPIVAERKAYIEQSQRTFRREHPELFEVIGPPVEGMPVDM